MVGSAIWRNLESKGYTNIIGKSSKELDLRTQKSVIDYFEEEKPEFVFLAAAKVGGILANDTYRAEFIYDNLQIQNNVIHQSYVHGVKKLLFLGSSCIYPRDCPQPMKEEYLLTGSLEPTNEPYAIAKIAGIKMCQAYRRQYGCDYISAMPNNLYGPGDNFDLESSHVVPALIRKFHEAKHQAQSTVEIWGTGKPKREFMLSDDCSDAMLFLMENYKDLDIINIGLGYDMPITEIARVIRDVVDVDVEFNYNINFPDGIYRKLLNTSKLESTGWKVKHSFKDGIKIAYADFLVKFERGDYEY